MNETKKSFNWILRGLIIALIFPVTFLNAQDYLLYSESFENKEDTTWTKYEATFTDATAYKGQNSIEIKGYGNVSKIISIPVNVNEIVVTGYIKLTGYDPAKEVSKEPAKKSKQEIDFNDTIELDALIIESSKGFQAASIAVETYGNTAYIMDGGVGFLRRNANWKRFEKTIQIPPGTSQLQITCRNTFKSALAYFDNIRVEKRQIGFVKKETAWAEAYRQMQQRANAIVQNGDFEDGANIWNAYWGFELSDVAHNGKYSCMIQNADSGAWKGTGNDELFNIPPGTSKLKITTWIKAENIIGGPNTWETGAMLMNFTDEGGNEIPGGGDVARTVGTHDWRQFEAYFDVSERAKHFKLLLQLAASTGKIYFDDIEATPLTEEEYYNIKISLQNPSFESQLNGWPSYAGIATTEEAHTGEYALKVAGENAAWEMRMQTIMLKKDQDTITFGGWIKTIDITKTPNVWEGARILVEFKNVHGIKLGDVAVGQAVGTTDWQYFSEKVAIPEGAVEATISCGRANVSGNAYFDDISIKYD